MLWRGMWLVLVHKKSTVLLVSAVLQDHVLVIRMTLLLLPPAKAEQRSCYLLFGNLLAQVSSDMYSCAPSMQSSFLLGLWWGWPLVSHLPAWPNLSLMGNLLLRVKVSRQNLGRALKLLLLHAAIWDRHIIAESITQSTTATEWSLTAESGLNSALPSWP